LPRLRNLVAALASSGDFARAEQVAAKLPRDAATESDLAAIALARRLGAPGTIIQADGKPISGTVGDRSTIPALRLARAILATRIAGAEVPTWLAERADLVGDPAHPASRVDDVYLCIACDSPLPVHEQVARAEASGRRHEGPPTARGLADGPPRCAHCRGESHALRPRGLRVHE